MNKPTGVWLKINPADKVPNELMVVTDAKKKVALVCCHKYIRTENFPMNEAKYYMILPFPIKDELEKLEGDKHELT